MPSNGVKSETFESKNDMSLGVINIVHGDCGYTTDDEARQKIMIKEVTKMRLIDADDPKLYEKTYIPQDWSGTQEYPLMIEWKDIVDAPTVDAEPVRRGKWIMIGADKRGRGGIFKCTDCGDSYPYKCKFCPNCGAKMSEEASK